MQDLNMKQKKFCDYYIKTGNATESYIRAGYSGNGKSAEANASRLIRNDNIIRYIKERNTQLENQFIADITEVKRFWSEILRDINAETKDRLKASEFLAKTNGAFVEKKELLGNGITKIEFGFVDPTAE